MGKLIARIVVCGFFIGLGIWILMSNPNKTSPMENVVPWICIFGGATWLTDCAMVRFGYRGVLRRKIRVNDNENRRLI